MGRYAAYSERTITVETGLAIPLGDGASCRRLRMRLVNNCLNVRRDGRGNPEPAGNLIKARQAGRLSHDGRPEVRPWHLSRTLATAPNAPSENRQDADVSRIYSIPPCVRQGVMWEGWSRNQMRSHSSVIARRSSEV